MCILRSPTVFWPFEFAAICFLVSKINITKEFNTSIFGLRVMRAISCSAISIGPIRPPQQSALFSFLREAESDRTESRSSTCAGWASQSHNRSPESADTTYRRLFGSRSSLQSHSLRKASILRKPQATIKSPYDVVKSWRGYPSSFGSTSPYQEGMKDALPTLTTSDNIWAASLVYSWQQLPYASSPLGVICQIRFLLKEE